MLSSTLIDSGTMRNETTEINMAHGPNCITRVTDSGNALEGTSDGRTVRADSVAVRTSLLSFSVFEFNFFGLY